MNQSFPLEPHGDSIPQLKDSVQAENPSTFWRSHFWWPLLAFAVVFGVLEALSLDRVIARKLFFNVHTAQWLGAGSGEWWARGLLHTQDASSARPASPSRPRGSPDPARALPR